MYGLNDPKSPNYIADQGQRILAAAELAIMAEGNSMTMQELIYYFIDFPFAVNQTLKENA
jgi:hypothetical protein